MQDISKGDKVRIVRCHRTYHLNLISVFASETGSQTCERTLIVLDREGIQRIEQFDAEGRPFTLRSSRLPLHLSEFADSEE